MGGNVGAVSSKGIYYNDTYIPNEGEDTIEGFPEGIPTSHLEEGELSRGSSNGTGQINLMQEGIPSVAQQVIRSYQATNQSGPPSGLFRPLSHTPGDEPPPINLEPQNTNFRDYYYGAWAHLALVTIHSIGALFLFFQPLSFNIFAVFTVAGIYYSTITIEEFLDNSIRERVYTYEKLIACSFFLVVANIFIAIRYLALLSSAPYYCLALVLISLGMSTVNYYRVNHLNNIQNNLVNPEIRQINQRV